MAITFLFFKFEEFHIDLISKTVFAKRRFSGFELLIFQFNLFIESPNMLAYNHVT